jgi:hypothetical protein
LAPKPQRTAFPRAAAVTPATKADS